ncbi:MAG: OmpA family protein [Chitinophagaceae bacterium]|jgi:outer membrane protein OmpA-like peptidoglycan-associated protein
MRKNWLLFVLATFMVVSQHDAQAQDMAKEKYRNKANDPVKDLPFDKKLKWADGLYREGSYFNAIEYYKQLKQEQPRLPYLTYQLAECSYATRDYVQAAAYFQEAYATAKALYPEAKYKEAVMLKMSGNFDGAIAAFNQFVADNPKKFKKLKKRALTIDVVGCVMAKNSINSPQPYTVKNAGPNVNSSYTESAPYPLGDTALLYSTMAQNKVVEVDKRNPGAYMSRFMTSTKEKFGADVDSFQWGLEFKDGNFNNPRSHVGNGCYSPGGDRFYFTRCKEEDSMKVICRIFISKWDTLKNRWAEPKELEDGINEEGSNTHPFIGKVGKKEVLFFSSDRKLQSRGGYDIWYSVYDPVKSTYRRPQNVGKQINTDQDEQTPYYDSRVNKLYFASNGWVSMGGFDIFSADGGPSRYTNLQNLGFPINSQADEIYYIKDPIGKPDAYVVSNRIGSMALKNPTCCDDIWRIQSEPKLRAIGKVVYRATGELATETVVKMLDETGDLKTFDSPDGKFAFNTARSHNYVITADKAGYTSSRLNVNTSEVKRTDPDDDVEVTIYLDEIIVSKPFEVSNIYYDFDKATLRPESVASLDTLVNFMKDNPSLSVEIYSFTDAKGDNPYNQKLSQDRATSVMEYLKNNGIDASRMMPKALGKEMPAAPNQTAEGKDNPEGRQLNRRTQFRIVKDDSKSRIIYDSSKPGNIDDQQNLKINEDNSPEEPADPESALGQPGSRVNKK